MDQDCLVRFEFQGSAEGAGLSQKIRELVKSDCAWGEILGTDWKDREGSNGGSAESVLVPRLRLSLEPNRSQTKSSSSALTPTRKSNPHPSVTPPIYFTLSAVHIVFDFTDTVVSSDLEPLLKLALDAACRGLRARLPLCFSDDAKKDFPSSSYAVTSLSRTLEDILSRPPEGKTCDLDSLRCEKLREEMLSALTFICRPNPASLLVRPRDSIAWRLRTLATAHRKTRETKLCKITFTKKVKQHTLVADGAELLANAPPAFDKVSGCLWTELSHSGCGAISKCRLPKDLGDSNDDSDLVQLMEYENDDVIDFESAFTQLDSCVDALFDHDQIIEDGPAMDLMEALDADGGY
ncbi:hypothetical protein HDU93_003292 [Gonapodya sp. JEL0774]|nr:hypothetical protein HDU93_003292 [Gonapodya sp. JEL0774]